MKKSAQMTAIFVVLSLVLSGCGQLTGQSGNSAQSSGNSVKRSTTHQQTGSRSSVSSSSGGNQVTSGQTGSSGKQSGSTPGKPSTSVHVSTPVAFSALDATPLTSVWFAPPGGTVASTTGLSATANSTTNSTTPAASTIKSGGQVGYVTDANHVYRTADGGKTWQAVATVTGSLIGVTSDPVQAGDGLTVAWTTSGLWVSTNGIQFTQANLQLPAAGLTQVSVAGGVAWLLDGGTLYRYINGKLQPVSSAAIGNVTSITAVDANTCYVVAASTAVYETTDGGNNWQQLFWPPLNAQLPWQTQIEVSGSHIAVLYAGGDSGVGQSAYIAVESNDGGTSWRPLFDNQTFTGDYGHPTPLVQQNLGSTALLFALLSNGNIVFVGTGSSAPKWTVVTPQGTVQNTFSMTVGGGVAWPDMATAAMFAPGGEQVVLVGGTGTRGVIDVSPTSGSTWDSLS